MLDGGLVSITPDLKEQRTDLRLFVVRKHGRSGTRYRHGRGGWGVPENAVEVGERLFIFALLFVDDAKVEKNLICLVEI